MIEVRKDSILPHSLEAERAIIGELLINNDSLDLVSDALAPKHFYIPVHSKVYESIIKLFSEGKKSDVITVSNDLQAQDSNRCDYFSEIAEIAASSSGPFNMHLYADYIINAYVLRSLITTSQLIKDKAYDPKTDPKTILDFSEKAILDIAEDAKGEKETYKTLKQGMLESIQILEERSKNGGEISGLSTGFVDIDKATSGLHPGQLILIAGRPGMGKSTFAMNIVEHVSLNLDKKSVVFSMEMPTEEIMLRMLSSFGRIDHKCIKNGTLADSWDRIISATSIMAKKNNIFFEDKGTLSPLDVRSKVRRIQKKEGKIDLIVIDYIQLMRSSISSDNRVSEISEISRSLKLLARELNIPIIALAQLNRSVETRVNKQPLMSDLRDSGSLEQDADLILFIHRDEVNDRETENKGIAEVTIGKQRSGPTGNHRLMFQGSFVRFNNFAPEFYVYDIGDTK